MGAPPSGEGGRGRAPIPYPGGGGYGTGDLRHICPRFGVYHPPPGRGNGPPLPPPGGGWCTPYFFAYVLRNLPQRPDPPQDVPQRLERQRSTPSGEHKIGEHPPKIWSANCPHPHESTKLASILSMIWSAEAPHPKGGTKLAIPLKIWSASAPHPQKGQRALHKDPPQDLERQRCTPRGGKPLKPQGGPCPFYPGGGGGPQTRDIYVPGLR